MRRADRLFQIVQLLRGRRSLTAAQLGERLEVSERTIYRDVADLTLSGVPIQGEAGVGYRLDKGFDLPPLMFDAHEVQALVLGARMVEAWADDALRSAAKSALDKIQAVLPPERRGSLEQTALFSLSFQVSERVREHVGLLRAAVEQRRRVEITYGGPTGERSERVIRPLGLYFWGGTWTAGAWCELRRDYRNFRLDRIDALTLREDRFELVSPVTLDEFVAAMRSESRD
jgi:predicted DNA-binding transcriptional regulator YafY